MTLPLPPIVVGSDGSPDARRALAWALEVAALHAGTRVHLVRALGLPALPLSPPGTTVRDLLDSQEREADERLEVERAEAAARGVPAETHLRRWLAAETILEHATTVGAGLLVVGQHGLGPTRLLLGSVSSRVARAASAPVVVIRGRETAAPPRQVLLAFDGSPSALRAAEAIARWLPTARVTALTVENELELPAADLAVRLGASGLAAGVVVAERTRGRVAEALLERAEKDGFDLLAAGRRGLSAWRELLLGGVSEKLVQLAPCPLLLAH